MEWIINISLVIAAFLFMEFIAWFSHKYIMHGFLWVLHKDHHIPHDNKLEKNDWFAFMFAIPAIVLIYFGFESFDYRFYLGIGITLYGLSYFLFHDVMVHQRLPILKGEKNWYWKATISAHKDHHTKGTQRNYGFLLAPFKYYLQELKKFKK
jgi:beta-carotene 3-hydroxylase